MRSLLLLVGVIHLLPAVGVFGGERLRALYELGSLAPNLELLLRHRAVLFALLGAYCAWAAFTPTHQLTALVAGLVSTASFLALAARVPQLTDALVRVVWVDRAAVVVSLVGLLLNARAK